MLYYLLKTSIATPTGLVLAEAYIIKIDIVLRMTSVALSEES